RRTSRRELLICHCPPAPVTSPASSSPRCVARVSFSSWILAVVSYRLGTLQSHAPRSATRSLAKVQAPEEQQHPARSRKQRPVSRAAGIRFGEMDGVPHRDMNHSRSGKTKVPSKLLGCEDSRHFRTGEQHATEGPDLCRA